LRGNGWGSDSVARSRTVSAAVLATEVLRVKIGRPSGAGVGTSLLSVTPSSPATSGVVPLLVTGMTSPEGRTKTLKPYPVGAVHVQHPLVGPTSSVPRVWLQLCTATVTSVVLAGSCVGIAIMVVVMLCHFAQFLPLLAGHLRPAATTSTAAKQWRFLLRKERRRRIGAIETLMRRLTVIVAASPDDCVELGDEDNTKDEGGNDEDGEGGGGVVESRRRKLTRQHPDGEDGNDGDGGTRDPPALVKVCLDAQH